MAEVHGISKRIVEREYSRLDYFLHVARKGLDNNRQKDYYKNKPKNDNV